MLQIIFISIANFNRTRHKNLQGYNKPTLQKKMQISSVKSRKIFALLHKEAVKNTALSSQTVFFYKAAG
jgi:hypothetical protein